MRRKVLQATLSALAIAVLFLGVPLAVFTASNVRDSAIQDLEARTVTAGRALEVRVMSGENISVQNLASYVGYSSQAPSFMEITTSDGQHFEVGSKPDRYIAYSHVTENGVHISMYVSWWDVFWRASQSVGIVCIVAVIALTIGMAVALLQANRLSAPLVYLAASAEQLGSGQVRLKVTSSGVEEIDLVAEELARSAARMGARLAAERQFASDASHQLRTPLTAMTIRLEEIIASSSEQAVKNEAEAALEQVERLVSVVDELLGRSRRAAGSNTEAVQLADVLKQQRKEWGETFNRVDRALVVENTSAQVFATPGGLAQVIATLVENSLVHGGGETRISVRESSDANAVVIDVADEGPGVDLDLAPRIFERSVTDGRGTGLGLALARDLVAADGGRIELSSRVPAVFSIFLQAVPPMVDLKNVVPHEGTGVIRTRKR